MTSPDLPNPLDTLAKPDRLRRYLLLLLAAQYLPLDLELDYLTFVLTYFYDSSLSFLSFTTLLASCCLPCLAIGMCSACPVNLAGWCFPRGNYLDVVSRRHRYYLLLVGVPTRGRGAPGS